MESILYGKKLIHDTFSDWWTIYICFILGVHLRDGTCILNAIIGSN